MNRQDASTTLAMRYQTSQLTLMTFPKWTWTTALELPPQTTSICANIDEVEPSLTSSRRHGTTGTLIKR